MGEKNNIMRITKRLKERRLVKRCIISLYYLESREQKYLKAKHWVARYEWQIKVKKINIKDVKVRKIFKTK